MLSKTMQDLPKNIKINFGSVNVRGLNKERELLNLANDFDQHCVDLAAIQETHLPGEERGSRLTYQ